MSERHQICFTVMIKLGFMIKNDYKVYLYKYRPFCTFKTKHIVSIITLSLGEKKNSQAIVLSSLLTSLSG